MSKGGGASIVASVAVSSVMTAAVALPMGVTALEAANKTLSSEEAIVTTDERFPDYVDLSTSELAALIEPTAEAAPEPDPSSTPSATAIPEPLGEAEDAVELAIVLPTPTPTLAPVPTPIPTVDAAPAPTARPAPSPTPKPRRTPRPERPTSQPDPTARPDPTAQPTPAPAQPDTPTTVPVATPTSQPTSVPTVEPPLPLPGTDVYAYIATEDILVEDETATIFVKAVNIGPASTTDVVLTVNVQGGTVTGVTPDPFGWSCSGAGSTWVCSGPFLESRDVGRNIVSLVPEADTVVVEVSVSHQAPDDQPGNDVTTSTLEVIDG